ncbi:exodeoxyribonuclease VII small subunit [Hoylesella timonensis]|uniref:Exodeoxyribonuclease VII small subunit n=1 Tax=Hoylesella timonensis TaxID=386414 RepID=A0A2K0XL31_9BACT|nr:exodeoxyribonuclease VII small subunit [Hoylesella timonensis]PNP95168.1 exodeoxyribonuclease VII small subunit [Hoylesella timonensis]
MAKEMNYEEAVQQLESIVQRMENDELDIDELTTELKKAQQLIKMCKAKLTKVDEDIKKILSQDN